MSRLEFEGGELAGTPSHRIWTQDGWTQLANLIPGSTLSAWAGTDQASSLSGMGRSTADTQSHLDVICGSTGTRSEERRSTATSTSTITGLFRSAITSIMSTVTHWITASRISRPSPALSISPSTCASLTVLPNPLSHCSSTPSPRPPSGTVPTRAAPGMSSTVGKLWQSVRSAIARAWFAVVHFAPRPKALRCAAATATPSVAVTPAPTTRPALAPNATASTSATSTVAPVTAPSRVRRVQPTGVALPVFNLTVDGEHEYFANGILVANCDADLYIHRESYHHRFREPPPPDPPKGSEEYLRREERELEEELDADEYD